MTPVLRKHCIPILLLAPLAAAQAEDRDWQFSAALLYGPRDIEGDVFVDRAGPASGLATADSLGLGRSRSMQYLLGAKRDRFSFSAVGIPTRFDGEGVATVEVDLGNGRTISTETPTSSTIDVDLYVGNLMYDALRGDNWSVAAGVGLGATIIDVALVPNLGQPLSFDDTTPFGFLALRYQHRFGRFGLLASIQDISTSMDGFSMDYANFNLSGTYTFHEGAWSSSAMLGYRRVSFDFTYDVDDSLTRTDVTLTGPYAGLAVTF